MNRDLSPIERTAQGNGQGVEPGESRRQGVAGERRVVTILFCDVTGSTAMAERLDPEEWAELMDDAFDYLIAPVQRYEGTVARLMGDAILAFFGAPLAHEDDPQRAVLAGLDILATLKPFGERVRQETGLEFNVRVGINTGTVVVGEIGSQIAMEYTAMGDAVNLAARMQAAAEPGTLQITESTYRLIAPLFDCEPLGPIEVKGKSGSVTAYRVLGRKAEPGPLRGIPGLHASLVGRKGEMTALRQAVADLRQGRPGIFTLIAEAGLGKSRLLEELKRETTSDGRQTTDGTKGETGLSSTVDRPLSIYWLESHGISYDTQRPYGLFRQQLRQSCGVSPVDPPEVAREKILQSMANAPFANSSDLERIRHTTEVLLSVEENPESGLVSGEAFKRDLYEVTLTVYKSIAENMPLVMVCDDLHWADVASVELLLHLFQLVETYPILFLCAFRPYRQAPGWKVKLHAETNYPHLYQEILLTPLPDADSDALIGNLLSISYLPEKLRHLIMEKAEGNPFFVEEIIRTLIERGAIKRDASGLHWQATEDVHDFLIPDSLQALLIARIDRLEPDVRHTLQLAAVIGRQFPYLLLQEIAGLNGRLDRHLSALQRAELVQEAGRIPELEYTFRHELTRDAAYETILHRQRRKFHLQVGEALERGSADQLEQVAHRLAVHFKEGRDLERALKYYGLAGDAAARLYANQQAADFYAEAIEIGRVQASEPELASLYTRRGRVLELCGEYDLALENYQELEVLAKGRGSNPLELAAVIPQATIFSTPTSKQDAQRGRELSLHALGLAREQQDYRAEAKALWNLMLIASFTNRDPLEGIAFGETALAITREHNLREELAYTLHDLYRLYGLYGQEEKARTALAEAQALWRELDNLPMLADSYSTAAEDLMLKGRIDEAIESGLEAQRISRSINSIWGEAYSLFMLGPAYLERGEFSKAITAIQTSIKLAKVANFWAPLVSGPAFLSLLYDFLGQPEISREWIQHVIAEGEKTLVIQQSLPVWRAYLRCLEGDPAAAVLSLKETAGEDWFESSEIFFGPLTILILGRILLANREFAKILQMIGQDVDEIPAARFRVALPDLFEQQGHALLGLELAEAAERKFEQALQAARQMGVHWRQPVLLSHLVRLAENRGDNVLAAERRRAGREQVEYLEAQIEEPDLKASFLSLFEVRTLLEETN